jgi:hypothetical protein
VIFISNTVKIRDFNFPQAEGEYVEVPTPKVEGLLKNLSRLERKFYSLISRIVMVSVCNTMIRSWRKKTFYEYIGKAG